MIHYKSNLKIENYMRAMFGLCAMVLCMSFIIGSAHAQRSYEIEAYASGAATLQSREGVIQLWGLDADALQNTTSGLRARITIDDLISDEKVECAAVKRESNRVIARCKNFRGEDIALELVKAGLGIVDRSQLAGTQSFGIYRDAERRARISQIGFWDALANGGGGATNTPNNGNELNQIASGFYAKDILLIVGVFLGPILGMLIICAVLYFGFDRMIKLQKRQMAMSQQKEKELRDREKFVLAASLESEINTNRAKIDAFLVIYEDMLRNLKDPAKTPKYKQSGDIIHQRPSLSRAVYDANLDRMDLVGPQLFSELSEIYAKISPETDYVTLEPDTPIEQAIDKVQKVIQRANELIAPMDKANSALSMIIRERKKKMPQPSSSGSL